MSLVIPESFAKLKLFYFEDYSIRVILKDSMPWFCHRDLCEVLGITDPYIVICDLDHDEKIYMSSADDLGVELCFVNEYGLFVSIFHAHKEGVGVFRPWVLSKVLLALSVIICSDAQREKHRL